ncbi:MAG: VanZ family protein [Desulfobulbaceae bacterium]|nr:VanZ family protein [Desulfobulbaceae bacterium]
MSIKRHISKFGPPYLFFLFLCWIIYLADSGNDSIFFKITQAVPNGDKIGHFVLYGSLAILLNHSLEYSSLKFFHFSIQKGALLVYLFAIFEEFSQYFFPNRTPSLIDILSDLFGIIIFTKAAFWWRQRTKCA